MTVSIVNIPLFPILKRKVVYGLNINKTGDEYVLYYMFVFYVVIIVV